MPSWKKLALAGGVGAGALAWPRLRARSLPLPAVHPGAGVPYAGLATSLTDELGEPVPVTGGQLPSALDGTLFINGPGLFERGGLRKRNLLDGDGLITAFTLTGGRVQLRSRFVR